MARTNDKDNIPCADVDSDSSVSDALSIAMSVDSSCSSPCTSKTNDDALPDEHVASTFMVKKAIIGGHLVRSKPEDPQESLSQDTVSDLSKDTPILAAVIAADKYTTQDIEQCLSRTQRLFQMFEKLRNKDSEYGFEVWNDLKHQLELLQIRSTNPARDVKPKYLHDVGRFRARVAASVQCHGVTFQMADERPAKRKRLSVSNDFTISKRLSVNDASTVLPLSTVSHSDEATCFLQGLEEEIYASILANLCPHNMRGSFCKAPITCIDKGRTFACPEYAIHQKCSHEKDQVFSHAGYKHTVKGCTVHHRNECKARHPSGNKCRTKVIYFHVRASCMSLRGSRFVCRTEPCLFGHDHIAIRKAVMAQDH